MYKSTFVHSAFLGTVRQLVREALTERIGDEPPSKDVEAVTEGT